MLKKVIYGLIVSTQLINYSYGCDQNNLDSQAIDLGSRVYNCQPISEPMVIKHLDFIYDAGSIREKYKNNEEFNILWDKKTRSIANDQFNEFAKLCKKIYEEEIDATKKSSIHMLFEKVSYKVEDYLNLQKIRSTERHPTENSFDSRILDFLNMDKGGTTISSH